MKIPDLWYIYRAHCIQYYSNPPPSLPQKLVAKPDQLLKRRGKLGLVKVNASYPEVQEWIGQRMEKELTVEKAVGKLSNFVVEPFVPHESQEEFYIRYGVGRERGRKRGRGR